MIQLFYLNAIQLYIFFCIHTETYTFLFLPFYSFCLLIFFLSLVSLMVYSDFLISYYINNEDLKLY